jgi:CubicO group peptidase (beta-lactamase class C family)
MPRRRGPASAAARGIEEAATSRPRKEPVMDGINIEYRNPDVDMKNWQLPENLRWSFQHIADFLPTAMISRGQGPASVLPVALRDLDSVPIPAAWPDEPPMSVGSVMASTDTDGWMLMHRGSVLAEQYFGTMSPAAPHLLMSVSKSLVGAVAGSLCDSGLLDPEALLTRYLPALAGTGYDGATVRHLLDMRSGIAFSEDYLDPRAEVRLLEQAIGWADPDAPGPIGMYTFLKTLRRKWEHGGVFEYRSCESDMLGWVCEAAAGAPMPMLLSHLLWGKLGAEYDASIGIDQYGTGMFDGGINASLRDMARFGSLFLNEGISPTGERVLSRRWIHETLAGAPDSRVAFAQSPGDNRMPGGMYRNQMWFPYEGNDVVICLGIHGQMVYINRPAQVVAVKLSSWPLPQDADKLFGTLRAFNAIAAMLASETPAASQAYLPLFAVPGREHPLPADSEPRTSA